MKHGKTMQTWKSSEIYLLIAWIPALNPPLPDLETCHTPLLLPVTGCQLHPPFSCLDTSNIPTPPSDKDIIPLSGLDTRPKPSLSLFPGNQQNTHSKWSGYQPQIYPRKMLLHLVVDDKILTQEQSNSSDTRTV